MAIINHINLVDDRGKIYCRKRNNVVTYDNNHVKDFCATCPMYLGSAQGMGVECKWDDRRPDKEFDNGVVIPNSPDAEYASILAWDQKNPPKKLVVKK